MTFQFRKAIREQESLLIGFAGGTGSGKTLSALKLAKGMTPEGQRFAVIDTEAGRAKHYALKPGEAPSAFKFDFDHGDLTEHRPNNYTEAIHAAEKAGYPVIVVDSMSHEWGGVLDWQEEEFKGMGYREAERMRSWIKPKVAHKKMVQELLQLRSHLILCFRAEMKVDMVTDPETHRTKVVAKSSPVGLDGWIPICDQRFPFELTASFLLLADNPGYSKPIKLEGEMRPYFPADRPISEESGQRLAEWARGGSAAHPTERPASEAVIASFKAKAQALGYPEDRALSFAEWDALEGHTRDELAAVLANLEAAGRPTEPRQEAMV